METIQRITSLLWQAIGTNMVFTVIAYIDELRESKTNSPEPLAYLSLM